ncbi:hypothetical protein [Kitasatospora griseola]|uniref:hypothetical protein n=1 Tax=Kitasatospora griseola TaxID=2064 RepID=UPI0019ACDAF0|nr:hypothetical protein GCM10010195_01460 [Kitasatospora griseola]
MKSSRPKDRAASRITSAPAARAAVSGLGITLGNLAVGALWDYAARHDARCLPWLALAATGLLCAAAVHRLARTGRLPHPAEEAAASPA